MQRLLAQHNQWSPSIPSGPRPPPSAASSPPTTPAPCACKYGSLRDLIIGMTIVLADGTIARSGGKVVKNVAGYDLHKLMTGAFGTLGIITEVTFRLHPLPKHTQTFTVSAPQATQLATSAHRNPRQPSPRRKPSNSAATQMDSTSTFSSAHTLTRGNQMHLSRRWPEPSACNCTPATRESWTAREATLLRMEPSVIKTSVLPTDVAWMPGTHAIGSKPRGRLRHPNPPASSSPHSKAHRTPSKNPSYPS